MESGNRGNADGTMRMEMRQRPEFWRLGRRAGWLALASASALIASGQSSNISASCQIQIPQAPGQVQVALQPGCKIFREIDDAATGDRWLLVAGVAGGPGWLILAEHRDVAESAAKTELPLAESVDRPVIRAGDAVIVEEHKALVDARLEAVALNPALKGALFRARLKLGGALVRARAIAPGSAVLAEASEGER